VTLARKRTRKKGIKGIIAVISVCIALVASLIATNPTKDDFVGWWAKKAGTATDSTVVEELINALTGTVAETVVERKNYIVFSTFEVAGQKFVGFYEQFYPLGSAENTVEE
jgi:hypothetical protein